MVSAGLWQQCEERVSAVRVSWLMIIEHADQDHQACGCIDEMSQVWLCTFSQAEL